MSSQQRRRSVLWFLTIFLIASLPLYSREREFCVGECSANLLAVRFGEPEQRMSETLIFDDLTATVVADILEEGVEGWAFGLRHDPSELELVDVSLAEGLPAILFEVTSFAAGDPAPVGGAGFTAQFVVQSDEPDHQIPPPRDDFPGPCRANEILVVRFDSPAAQFRRGDCDGDGEIALADPVRNLAFLFLGEAGVPCVDACDFEDNGLIEIGDPIANLSHQFLGGSPPAPPGKDACGVDPTEDALNCERFAGCPVGG